MNQKQLEKLVFFLSLVCILYFSWLILFPYLSVVILSLALTLVFQPWHRSYLKIFKNESLSALAIVLSVILIVFIPISFLAVRIFNEATTLSNNLSLNGGYDFGGVISNFLHNYFSNWNIPTLTLNYNEFLQRGLSWITSNLGTLTSSLGIGLFTGFLSLLGLYYFLKDGRSLKNSLFKVIPLNKEYLEEIITEIKLVMNSVIKGTIIVALMQGVAAGISFFIFKVPDPLLWAFIVCLFSPIPIIGTWLVLIPAIAFLFLSGQSTLSLGLLIWSVVVVNIIYNLIAPKLMHRGNNIHPFVILLSILGGISVFGPIGFLLGPLITAFLWSLMSIYPKLMK